MDGNPDATLSTVLEAIDWGTAATDTNVVVRYGHCARDLGAATGNEAAGA